MVLTRPASPRWAWGSPLARLTLGVLALLPFLRLVWLTWQEQLGANPLEFVTRSTGTWALVMLCLTLCVTPLRRLTGWHGVVRHRRMLGLYVLFYASLHAALWLAVDQGGDVGAMWRDVVKRPFITVGFAAFVLLLPLGATSFNRAVRWLGGQRWQALHRLVYAVAVLAVVHYWWHKAGKQDFAVVSRYALWVGLLLGWRLYRRLKPVALSRQ